MSSEVVGFSRTALLSVLEASVRNNKALHVTGLLLYKAGNFLQVLEGARKVVESLYAKIRQDPRHRRVTTLLKGDIPKREFPDWSMAFRDLSMEKRQAEGYSRLLNGSRPAIVRFPREFQVFAKMFENL